MNLWDKLCFFLKSDMHLSEILKGSAIAFSIKVFSAGLAFLMNILISRQLGAEQAGIYFLGLTLITISATIGRAGLENTFIRFIAASHSDHNWYQINAIYRFGILSSLIFSFFIALIIWFSSDFISNTIFEKPNLSSTLRNLAITIPFLALFTLHANAFQGLKKVFRNLFLLSLAVPLFFVCLLYIYPISTAIAASYYYLIVSIFTMIIGVLLWWFQKNARLGSNSVNMKVILYSCVPLLTVQVLNLFINHIGQLFLGAWYTSSDVAIFNAAQKTAMLTSFILVAVNSISAPKFSAMYQQGEQKALAKLAVQTAQLMTILAFPALMLMVLFPEFLLGFFGNEFREGALILIILAMGQFINVATGSVGYLLIMTGNEKVLRNNTFISAFISIALGIWLIPVYGLMGAAISTAITVATANLLSCWRVYQKLGFWTLPFINSLQLIIVFILLCLLIAYIVLAAHKLSIDLVYLDFVQLFQVFVNNLFNHIFSY